MHITFRKGFSFEDVLRTSWDIFTKDPAPFIALPFLVNIPYFLFSYYFYLNGEGETAIVDIARSIGVESLTVLIPMLAVGGIFYFLFNLLIVIVISHIVHDMIQKKNRDMMDIIKRSVRRLFPYIATELLKILIILGVVVLGAVPIIGISLMGEMIGGVIGVLYVIALVIGFIVIGIYWFFTPYIVALCDIWAIDALRRSYQIVKGKWWKVFGYMILFGLMVGIPLWILSSLVLWRVENDAVSTLITLSAQIIVNAFAYVFNVVFFLYLDYEYANRSQEKGEKRESEEKSEQE